MLIVSHTILSTITIQFHNNLRRLYWDTLPEAIPPRTDGEGSVLSSYTLYAPYITTHRR
jgi:hypothetical protein